MAIIDITIDFTSSPTDPGKVPDPSNGAGVIMPVHVITSAHAGPVKNDPLSKSTEEFTVLNFLFAYPPDGWVPQFTGFRYYNTAKHWDSGWWTPDTKGAVEFENLVIKPENMQVTDRTHDKVLYIYVVEWRYEKGPRGYYVCDPKIKNEPMGGTVSPASK